jgi:hypothetical protein
MEEILKDSGKLKRTELAPNPEEPPVLLHFDCVRDCVCAQHKLNQQRLRREYSEPLRREWAQFPGPCRAKRVEYHAYGGIHRDPAQGPARMLFCDQAHTNPVAVEYHCGGRLHRDPEVGPAYIEYDAKSGVVVCEGYYWKGKAHRLNGPAIIRRDGGWRVVISNLYMQHGLLHRKNGPAEMHFDRGTGMETAIKYYRWGKLHRVNGPATASWNRNGDVFNVNYYTHGVQRPRPAVKSL